MSRPRVRVLTVLAAVALAAGAAWLGWFLWTGRQPPARARLVRPAAPHPAAVASAPGRAAAFAPWQRPGAAARRGAAVTAGHDPAAASRQASEEGVA